MPEPEVKDLIADHLRQAGTQSDDPVAATAVQAVKAFVTLVAKLHTLRSEIVLGGDTTDAEDEYSDIKEAISTILAAQLGSRHDESALKSIFATIDQSDGSQSFSAEDVIKAFAL